MRQGRHAVFVGQVHVGLGVDQQLHYLLVAWAAVAQHNGLHQRRPAQAIDVVHVDTGGNQDAHGF